MRWMELLFSFHTTHTRSHTTAPRARVQGGTPTNEAAMRRIIGAERKSRRGKIKKKCAGAGKRQRKGGAGARRAAKSKRVGGGGRPRCSKTPGGPASTIYLKTMEVFLFHVNSKKGHARGPCIHLRPTTLPLVAPLLAPPVDAAAGPPPTPPPRPKPPRPKPLLPPPPTLSPRGSHPLFPRAPANASLGCVRVCACVCVHAC